MPEQKQAESPPVLPDENLPFLLDDNPSKAGEQQGAELTFAQVPPPPPLRIEPSNQPMQWFQYDAAPISVPYGSGRASAENHHSGPYSLLHVSATYLLQ